MREIAKEYVEVEVSESEAVEYYNKNPEKYFKTPHYDVRTIFLQITEPSNTSEMAEAYDDAMLYIEMLNSGKSWERHNFSRLMQYLVFLLLWFVCFLADKHGFMEAPLYFMCLQPFT